MFKCHIFQDGSLQFNKTDNNIKNGVSIDFSKVYVGRNTEDNFYGQPYNRWPKSIRGKVSDFNMWNRPLTLDEMKMWTNCRYKLYII